MIIAGFIACLFLSSVSAQTENFADKHRIETQINQLATYGANTPGVMKRVAFSNGDIEARKYITGLMQAAGLTVSTDAAGNIFGRRKGKNNSLPYVAFGSHLDAVPDGGIYDGDLGVIGAIECIDILNQNHIETVHPLEVIMFTDEEEGLIGSRAMTGHLPTEELNNIMNCGKTLRQGINDVGGNANELNHAKIEGGSIAAFIELHIEQGSNLETSNTNIGIVEGIVGMKPYTITIEGKANHAGTTPMKLRKDALLAAAKLIVAINEAALSMDGRQVATVGQIAVTPGGANVIPGKATISLDLRDMSAGKMDLLFNIIKHKADSIAHLNGTVITFIPKEPKEPVKTDKEIQLMIAKAAAELNLTTKYLPSGALHDTQDMAKLAPAAMIFVPSKNGISHSPDEYSSPEDMKNGINVLYKTILKADQTFK
ncbi:MAG: M20 family metallo-hydrolase [Bacteroidota bacterium]|nr:M20 family metallo-hydrolase [Bacteroidota bacterium]